MESAENPRTDDVDEMVENRWVLGGVNGLPFFEGRRSCWVLGAREDDVNYEGRGRHFRWKIETVRSDTCSEVSPLIKTGAHVGIRAKATPNPKLAG